MHGPNIGQPSGGGGGGGGGGGIAGPIGLALIFVWAMYIQLRTVDAAC